MKLAEQLRNNVETIYKPKQLKYPKKLFRKLERLSKCGTCEYEIIPRNMPSWFRYDDYDNKLIMLLSEKGFKIETFCRRHECGFLYDVIQIKW